MAEEPKQTQSLTCKCGNKFDVTVPHIHLQCTVHLSQVIYIPDAMENRKCSQCELVWVPRVKEPKNIEWVAFKKPEAPAGLAKPSLGDVQKFG